MVASFYSSLQLFPVVFLQHALEVTGVAYRHKAVQRLVCPYDAALQYVHCLLLLAGWLMVPCSPTLFSLL